MKLVLITIISLLTLNAWSSENKIMITSTEPIVSLEPAKFIYISDQDYLSGLCGHPDLVFPGIPYWSHWYYEDFDVVSNANQTELSSEIRWPFSLMCKVIPYDLVIETAVDVPTKGRFKFTLSVYNLRGQKDHPLDSRFSEGWDAVQCNQVETNIGVCTVDLSKINFDDQGEYSSRNQVRITYFTNQFKAMIKKGLILELKYKNY